MSDQFNKSQGNTTVIVAVVALIILVLAAAFLLTRNKDETDEDVDVVDTDVNTLPAQDEPSPTPLSSASPSALGSPSASPATSGAATQGAVKEFTVTGTSFKFTPAQIKVNEGDTVRVTFKNENGMHDWRLDEFNVGTKVIGAGQQETVEFVASKAGQYEYYCSVGQHRQLGMKGTLVVE